MPKPSEQMINEVTRELTERGLLIEAGFASYRIMVIPPDAPEVQVQETRMAFFGGAQHLFGSLMRVFDPDEGVTDADLARLDAIDKELLAFIVDFELRVAKTKGQA